MARHPIRSPGGEDSFRRIVDACFRGEAGSSVPLPGDTADLIETGVLDSMAWVSFLRAVETASGTSDLGSDLNEQPASIASILAALRSSNKGSLPSGDKRSEEHTSELQSQSNLVCRLLLEKKNKQRLPHSVDNHCGTNIIFYSANAGP